MERPDHWRATLPLVVDLAALVAKELHVELKAAVLLQQHDAPHLAEELRRAVRRKAHDFVFVAVVRKAEELSHRLIEDAKRMRKVDAAIDLHLATASGTPRSAREIAEAVHRYRYRFLEGRHEESRAEMREVMLDRMHAAVPPAAERFGQLIADASPLVAMPDPLEHGG